MAHKKKHGPPPVPPANRPKKGPADPGNSAALEETGAGGGAPFQEHDPKRRLGDFEGAGEHPRQQPTPLNDGQQHSR